MSLSKKLLFLCLIVLTQLGSAQPGGVAEPEIWKLLPTAQVDSAGIFLDQILTASGATQVIPHLRLSRCPPAGQIFSLSRAEVARLAQANATALYLTNWTGALDVRVARRMRPFEDSDLLELLTAKLQKEYVKNQGELELQLTRPWVKIQTPDEPITLKITEMPGMGVAPSFIVTFELWDGRERLGNWQVALKAAVWRDIPVAASALNRGQPLKGADIAMERSDVLIQRDACMTLPTLNESLELSEGVAAGRPILNRMVRIRPLVLRGQLVEGVFQDGTLAISLMVETLEDGALGQTVRVRNPKTKRELYGKVESEKTVRITL